MSCASRPALGGAGYEGLLPRAATKGCYQGRHRSVESARMSSNPRPGVALRTRLMFGLLALLT
ncbi:hypothetical protein, partial [Frankia sp. Cas4]|uniref:hypothetical protein n=1 Tax=Frankia sp. Cas4 TaxID=3073927 RepID=UPI002AD3DDA7